MGQVAGSLSPAFSAITGKGFMKDLLGTLSPAYGMASGNGLFGHLVKGHGKPEDGTAAPPMPGATQAPQQGMPAMQAPAAPDNSAYLNDLLGKLGVYGNVNPNRQG